MAHIPAHHGPAFIQVPHEFAAPEHAIDVAAPAAPDVGGGRSLRDRACAIACGTLTTLGSLAVSGFSAWKAYEWDKADQGGGGSVNTAMTAAIFSGLIGLIAGGFTTGVCVASCGGAPARVAPLRG